MPTSMLKGLIDVCVWLRLCAWGPQDGLLWHTEAMAPAAAAAAPLVPDTPTTNLARPPHTCIEQDQMWCPQWAPPIPSIFIKDGGSCNGGREGHAQGAGWAAF